MDGSSEIYLCVERAYLRGLSPAMQLSAVGLGTIRGG